MLANREGKKCFSESHLWGKRRHTGECRRLIDRGGTGKRSVWDGAELSSVLLQLGASRVFRLSPAQKKKTLFITGLFQSACVPTIDVLFLVFFPSPAHHCTRRRCLPWKKIISGSMLSPPSRKRIRNIKKIQNNPKKQQDESSEAPLFCNSVGSNHRGMTQADTRVKYRVWRLAAEVKCD